LHIVGAGERQDRPRAWPGKGLASHICESALDRGTAIPGDQARASILRAVAMWIRRPLAPCRTLSATCWKAAARDQMARRPLMVPPHRRSVPFRPVPLMMGEGPPRAAANDAVERLVVEFGRTGLPEALSFMGTLQRYNHCRIAKEAGLAIRGGVRGRSGRVICHNNTCARVTFAVR
jgi:hypothetical protein